MSLDERIRELVDRLHGDAPHPVMCILPDLTIGYANTAAGAEAGVDASDLVGTVCHVSIVGSSTPCSECVAREVFRDQQTRSVARHATDLAGVSRWMEERWQPIFDVTGRVVCVLRETHDETEKQPVAPTDEIIAESQVEHGPLQQFFDAAPAIIMAVDSLGMITRINRAGSDMLGRPAAEVIGHNWLDEFVPIEQRDACRSAFQRTVEGLAPDEELPCEHDVMRADGTVHRIEWHTTLIRDDDDAVIGVLCSGIDVTRRTAAEEELRFRSAVLDKANDAVVVHDPDGRPIYANERVCSMCGYTREEFLAIEPFGWLDAEHREVHETVREALARTGAAIFETLYLARDGTRIPVEVHATAADVNGRNVIVTAGRDITDRKRSEQAMSRLAFYDPLTGLANRALFLDRLRHAASASRRTGERLAVAFVDLDHFKNINDSLGHSVGDTVLMEIARRIKSTLRDADTVARLGGDEFTVLMTGTSTTEDAERVAGKLSECFRTPVVVSGRDVFVTASIGVALGSTEEHEDVGALLGRADAAMYEAKHSGRDTYCLHDARLTEEDRQLSGLRNDLHGAAERGEFELRYQPILRVDDGVLAGLETLIRWNHPEMGQIAPGTFLPIAEESSLIVDIGHWTVRTACEQFGRWRRMGLVQGARLTVNLSARQFADQSLARRIGELLYANGFEPGALELEITEDTFRSGENLRVLWEELRDLGVRISIDDFGRGHSSLDQLLRFEVDAIKIDHEFVWGLGRNARATAVCRAVISIAKQLGIDAVAEGVETRVQHACLRSEHCDEMQGYLISPALPADLLEPLLRKRTLIA
ncbi:MAG: EAL domain-containing protein [Coriobacteriia bacterium]|jgi:diguanylate cyclase (GGDEF)-like protein/PAS domain S-box-containing protein|nr:EAL domain-containing protein [Coriobacteriia bacterium]